MIAVRATLLFAEPPEVEALSEIKDALLEVESIVKGFGLGSALQLGEVVFMPDPPQMPTQGGVPRAS